MWCLISHRQLSKTLTHAGPGLGLERGLEWGFENWTRESGAGSEHSAEETTSSAEATQRAIHIEPNSASTALYSILYNTRMCVSAMVDKAIHYGL